MKHMETLKQEPYEAPAILEIKSVTPIQVHGTSEDPIDEEPDEI